MVVAVLLVLGPGPVRAEWYCLSVVAFNAEAADLGYAVSEGYLTLEVTEVDTYDWDDAILANLVDTRDTEDHEQPCVGITHKIYGALDENGDQGRCKQEMYNNCCDVLDEGDCGACGTERDGGVFCEMPVGDWRTDELYIQASQTCTVVIGLRAIPDEVYFDISCDNGRSDSDAAADPYGIEVDHIVLLQHYDGHDPLPEAQILSDEFCFDRPEQGDDDDSAGDDDVGDDDVDDDDVVGAESSTIWRGGGCACHLVQAEAEAEAEAAAVWGVLALAWTLHRRRRP